MTIASRIGLLLAASGGLLGCSPAAPTNDLRASGYVEATEITVASEVGGRLLEVGVKEGDRVAAGDVVARLDTRDVTLQMARVRADRAVAEAQLRLVEVSARVEDVRYAQAQVDAAESEVTTLEVEAKAAELDLERFESLLKANAGSQKQRDDARARLDLARERQRGSRERVRVAREGLARVQAGARPEEVTAARTRIGTVDAQLALLNKSLDDAVVKAPVAGIVTQDLADAGEIVGPRTPLLVVTDLDHAWANAFVPEPAVPRIKLGQAATVRTDAGQTLQGTVTFVSSRAEFTPRNVQTAEERSRLVYRVKVTVDNSGGILKQGMPVDVDLVLP
ncbi:MAG TPA: HlyD family efflux transporter periplasmic adaptor subunit [Vicinamibacterales bacterium]